MNIFKKVGVALSNLKIDIARNSSKIAVYGGLGAMVLGAGGLVWATAKTVEDKYEKPDQSKEDRIKNGFKRFAAPVAATVGGAVSVVWGYNKEAGKAAAYASLAGSALTAYNASHDIEGDDHVMVNVHTEEEKTVDENGVETIEEKKTLSLSPDNQFVEIFDENTSEFFEDSYDHEKGVHSEMTINLNLKVLDNIVNKWNEIMRARQGRPVYYNEIRAELGMENVKWGQVAGWRFDPKNPTGDNYIDLRPHVFSNKRFGIDNDGYTILLDPNFDGSVLEYEVN